MPLSTTAGAGIGNAYNINLAESNGNVLVGYNDYNRAAVTRFNGQSSDVQLISGIEYGYVAAMKDGYMLLGQSTQNSEHPLVRRFDHDNNEIASVFGLHSCYSQLKIKAVKTHPTYGVVVVGTMGGSYGQEYTVYFNLTDDLSHTCPSNEFISMR